MKTTLDYALDYLSQGIAVIPSNPKNKAPLVKWVEFQKRLPTKEEVISMFNQFPKSMISVVTGRVSGLVVIDADSDEAVKKIEEYLPDSIEYVIDVSPRGGRHYWFQMNGIEYQSKSGIFEKCDIKCNGGVLCVPPSRNDVGGEYRFLNQLDFKREMLNPMPEGLSKFIESLHTVPSISQYSVNNNNKLPLSFYNIINNINNKNATFVPKALELFKEGARNTNLFPLALSLREAHRTPEYILQVLINIVPKMASTVEGLKELIGIVTSAFSHEERKERKLSEEVREWVLSTTGHFLSTDTDRELNLMTRVDKNNRSKIMERLLQEGIIEKYGEKRGSFRVVDKKVEYMDYVNAIPESVDLLMPFHLHDVAEITPKAIIVIAGATNSGKTAFFLNLIKMNMEKFNSFLYLNSETSASTFRKRLDKFGEPISFWQDKLKVIDRCSNFADVVDPDGFNVIDYLELDPEKTFKVSEYIRNIFNKLNRGIAFIGLQKASKASFGRGGEFTLEKAQLAISMDYDKAKIVKCKSPKNGFAYHNSTIDFNITYGCNILEKSGWKQE